ncbi:hypothetical protein FKM82_004833 [Ascaphus truei]
MPYPEGITIGYMFNTFEETQPLSHPQPVSNLRTDYPLARGRHTSFLTYLPPLHCPGSPRPSPVLLKVVAGPASGTDPSPSAQKDKFIELPRFSGITGRIMSEHLPISFES